MRIALALALVLWVSWATPAQAVIGDTLARSAAVCKAQGVTRADFIVQDGRVIFETWRSYPGDSYFEGKPWPRAKAAKLRHALAGGRKIVVLAPRIVQWSNEPVPTHYLKDGSMILEPTQDPKGGVYIFVAGTLASIDAPAAKFDGTSQAWVLTGGKLAKRRPSDRLGQ